jgi:thioredoxin 1
MQELYLIVFDTRLLLSICVSNSLGVSSNGNIESKASCCSEFSSCCPSDSNVTEATTDSDVDAKNELEHIDTLSRWEEVFTATKNSILIVKFTAEWCKPCKQIQPIYSELSTQYHQYKFTTLDVDGDECDVLSSKMKVAMMPTFVCFRKGIEVGRVTGGNSEEKLKEWVGQMCS